MSEQSLPQGILNLPVADRIALATKIWESVADDAVQLSAEHKKLLDARILEADVNPNSLIPAEDVFSDLWGER